METPPRRHTRTIIEFALTVYSNEGSGHSLRLLSKLFPLLLHKKTFTIQFSRLFLQSFWFLFTENTLVNGEAVMPAPVALSVEPLPASDSSSEMLRLVFLF